ncbi:FecR family protein [Sabulilitoribacter arenilitoris]|uniref:FecR family protein n=1 Tax=Wocania arenilitoris TaxID=2044858 RepID=A0AAE3JKL2_9FLAO|nr:FecR family protein [Wocania arenilitoris]MCF7567187.1 FecR family protein [Wocania arenilitoris]
MIDEEIKIIITRCLTNTDSKPDREKLNKWLNEPENQSIFNDFIEANYIVNYGVGEFNTEAEKQKVFDLIRENQTKTNKNRFRRILKYAAVFIGLIGLSYVYIELSNGVNSINDPEILDIDLVNEVIVEPGTDKAILTLGDGSQVALEKGTAYQTKNTVSDGEKIVYKDQKERSNIQEYNFLTIPRGGQYFVELSDGTQVWLNSESQIKFPVNFIEGETRIVELIYGEAYFDVSPSYLHKGSKFKVINQFQEIEVIGTKFNVSAYKDELDIYTTLVEGVVKVDNGVSNQNLEPNQQLVLNRDNNLFSLKQGVDVESIASWTRGVFSFNEGKSLKNIMKVISRWYDVDVVFMDKNLESVRFKGILKKQLSIDEVLSIMKSSTINSYELKDRTVILR